MNDYQFLQGCLQADSSPFSGDSGEFDNALHAANAALNLRIKELLVDIWEREKVDTTRVCSSHILGDVWQEALINVFGDERCERGKTFHNSKKDFD